MNSIKLLLSLIEGPVDTEIYRKIADSLDDFTILKKRLESIYERFSLKKDSFKNQIVEGFDIFTLINQLCIALVDVKTLIKPFSSKNSYIFFKQNTGNVEI
jgi:hypothetical protein